jgi:hypothetical protein
MHLAVVSDCGVMLFRDKVRKLLAPRWRYLRHWVLGGRTIA